MSRDTAYTEGVDREQEMMLPACVDDYIGADNLTRAVDAFGDTLALPGREMDSRGGRPGYDPQTMAKLYIWGYINRIKSTRRLETEAGRNLELMWLLRGLRPDHSSISRFRSNNAGAIKTWLKEFNLVCATLGLFGGKEIAIDGAFLKAPNSKSNNHSAAKLRKHLAKLGEKIDSYLAQLKASEGDEDETANQTAGLKDKLGGLDEARKKTRALLAAAEASPVKQVSTVDPDALSLKKTHGGPAIVGHLVEIAVDSKEHLIAAAELPGTASDRGQLTPMATAAAEVLSETDSEAEAEEGGKLSVLADGAYFVISDIATCEAAGFEPSTPTYPQRKSDAEAGRHPASSFHYDPATDTYTCPEGEQLNRHTDYRSASDGSIYQTYYNTAACRNCPAREACTKGKYKKIHRHSEQASVERMRARAADDPGASTRRASLVEHPFGSMLFWNEGRALLCCGLEKAAAEFTLSCLAYNIKRAAKAVGIDRLIEAIRRRGKAGKAGGAGGATPGTATRPHRVPHANPGKRTSLIDFSQTRQKAA